MLSFFAMSFVDLVGTGTNFIKKDFGLSDTMAGTVPADGIPVVSDLFRADGPADEPYRPAQKRY